MCKCDLVLARQSPTNVPARARAALPPRRRGVGHAGWWKAPSAAVVDQSATRGTGTRSPVSCVKEEARMFCHSHWLDVCIVSRTYKKSKGETG
mmetsp:Transcript_38526/g.104772  ORF Transcript_38526/g.104772 Transcript_38526/m.104772 type:complete len:93 (-) Transcript_38526:378-656(-)